MKNAVTGLGTVAIAVAIYWLWSFGPQSPCDALRAELPALLDAQPHSAQAAVVKTINRMSAFQCASIALRIRAGDKDAFILSVAK